MGVKIGKKNYKLADIDKIPDAASSRYGDAYWDDFTDEQRKEMWYGLGMTPANYAYVQTWKAREAEIGKIIAGNREFQNDEYMDAMARNKELSDLVMNGEIGEKGVMQAIFEVLMDTNKATRESNMQAAMALEYQMNRDKQEEVLSEPPTLSAWWGENYFRPIDEEEFP
jgi:hypothetical protein